MTGRSSRRSLSRWTCLWALFACMALCSVPARARTEETRIAIDVPGLSLADALLRLSDQAGIQLLAAPDIIANVQTQRVKGRYTVADALDRLLAGSGLRWRYLAPRTITIDKTPDAPAPNAETPPIRTFAPVRIVGKRSRWPLTDGGSTDATATEDNDAYAPRRTRVASKVARALADTPQSVSVLTRQQLTEQNLTDIPAALQQMPGVSARMVDGITGWTFLSRGFEIHTFSFDGGGPSFYQSPIDADVRSMLDTPELAEFDHIEILRGAAGVFGGVSYPGGVIDFQRKRPLDRPRAEATLQLGAWNNRRIEADVSLPIAFAGRVRARAVGLSQSRDFFYDVTHENRDFGYGMVEAEIGGNLLMRGGGSYRDLRRPGFNAAGLPRYDDGSALGLSRKTCLCPESNRYRSRQSELFFSGEWQFAQDWQVMVNGTWRSQDTKYAAKLAVPAIMQAGGSGYYFFFGNSYTARNGFLTADAAITGSTEIAGRILNVVAGFDYTRNTSYTANETGHYGGFMVEAIDASLIEALEAAEGFVDFETLPGQRAAVMQFGPFLRLSVPLTSRLSVDIGLRQSFYRMRNWPAPGNDGQTSITMRYFEPGKKAFHSTVLPALSASYRIDSDFSLHVNYSRVFQPQLLLGPDGNMLPSARGATYEAKLGWDDPARDRLASLAVYYQDVRDFSVPWAEAYFSVDCCHELARRAQSHGMDAEFAGTLLPGWRLRLAYNWNRARRRLADGSSAIDTQQPEHRATLWTSYRPADGRSPWSMGAGFRFESRREARPMPCSATNNATGYCLSFDTPAVLTEGRFVQPAYIVADVRLARKWGGNGNFETAINVTNLFDRRYYATVSLPSMGNYYGEPRAIMLTMKAGAGR